MMSIADNHQIKNDLAYRKGLSHLAMKGAGIMTTIEPKSRKPLLKNYDTFAPEF